MIPVDSEQQRWKNVQRLAYAGAIFVFLQQQAEVSLAQHRLRACLSFVWTFWEAYCYSWK